MWKPRFPAYGDSVVFDTMKNILGDRNRLGASAAEWRKIWRERGKIGENRNRKNEGEALAWQVLSFTGLLLIQCRESMEKCLRALSSDSSSTIQADLRALIVVAAG